MLLSFLLVATSAVGPQPSPTDWQPVHIWSDPAQALSGSPVRVFVNLETPGYLLVLRRRPNGMIDVLFPASPAADPYTPEGTYEITGSSGGAAFTAAETGSGTLLAARSDVAFQAGEFVRGTEWDAAMLGGVSPDQDAEAALTEIVQRMLGPESFNYDLTMYGVNAPEPEEPLATTPELDVPLLVYDVAPADPRPVAPVPLHCRLTPSHRGAGGTAAALAVYQGGQLSVMRPAVPAQDGRPVAQPTLPARDQRAAAQPMMPAPAPHPVARPRLPARDQPAVAWSAPPARDQRPVARLTLPPIVIVQPRTHVHVDVPVAPATTSAASGGAPREWVVRVNPRSNGATESRARVATSSTQASLVAPAPLRVGGAASGAASIGQPSGTLGGIVAARAFAVPRVQFGSVALPGVVAIPRQR